MTENGGPSEWRFLFISPNFNSPNFNSPYPESPNPNPDPNLNPNTNPNPIPKPNHKPRIRIRQNGIRRIPLEWQPLGMVGRHRLFQTIISTMAKLLSPMVAR